MVEQTFSFRKTHPLPTSVPTPPKTWTEVYAAMAIADDLQWRTLDALLDAVRAFLEPALAGAAEEARWSPSSWSWRLA